jgi:hypothetical protein
MKKYIIFVISLLMINVNIFACEDCATQKKITTEEISDFAQAMEEFVEEAVKVCDAEQANTPTTENKEV